MNSISKLSRRPKNEAEGQFYDAAAEAGWTATKRGWPDFFCFREDGSICAVEVKPYARRSLTRHQLRIARAMALHGIPTYKWSPDGGFEEIRSTV